MRNPLFGAQTGIDARKFRGVRYGLEVDVTGHGGWVEQGLFDTKREAEAEGRAIRKKEGMAYHVKLTRDRRNGITDRAKRYRAQKNRPNGPRICCFCGSRQNIDLDHIWGDESANEPEDLMWLCRSCNTRKGVIQKRNHIGVRTRQYNPERVSFSRFKQAARVLLGVEPGDAGKATATIAASTPAQRADFAERISAANPFKSEAQRRKFYAMLGRGEITRKQLRHYEEHNPAWPTFAQYAHGVSIHRRGAHDEGGRIIHATPPNIRHRYAQQIARVKSQRRGEVPF